MTNVDTHVLTTAQPGAGLSPIDQAVAGSPAVLYAREPGSPAKLRYISANIEALTGYPASRFMDSPNFARERLHPDDVAAYRTALDRLSETGAASLEYRLKGDDNRYRWFRDDMRFAGRDGSTCGEVVGCMIEISPQKQAEIRLRDAEVFKAAVTDAALEPFIVIDEAGVIVDFNPEAERIFGCPRDNAIGQSFIELIVPEKRRQRHGDLMCRIKARGESGLLNRILESEAMKADGSIFPIELKITEVNLADRRLFVVEIWDISERVQARQERQRLAQLLHDAVECIPNGLGIYDADDRVILCNQAYASFFGETPRSMIGRSAADNHRQALLQSCCWDGERVDLSDESLAHSMARLRSADGEPIELRLENGDWKQVTSHPIGNGGRVYVRSDITRLKQAEASLRESEQRFRNIVETCPLPLSVVGFEGGEIIYESPAAATLFGRSWPAEGRCQAVSCYADPADREAFLEAMRKDGGVDGYEVELIKADGTRFSASVAARLIEHQGAQVIVCSVFDLTERKAVEEEIARQREALHQSEKLSALGSLLAGVAHELNNPLSVVVGQALLLKETAIDPKIAERAGKIGHAADRCSRIVRTFLAMARQQPSQRTTVDLNDVIEATLEVTGYSLRTANIDVTLDLSADLPPVWADEDQMNQVVTNLIVNAQQAMAETRGARRLQIATALDEDLVLLSVRDSGPGIRPEIRSRIFEPFFTTKEVGGGTGIGLAVCHRIVESFDGEIAVDSEVGRGAAFTIALPTATPRSVVLTDDEVVPQASRSSKLLVIDDEAEVTEMLKDILTEDGHEVKTAESGKAALDLLSRQEFDVILSDLRMPNMDGPRLFEVLRELSPKLLGRVGFVTGDTFSPSVSTFLTESRRPFVQKPFTPEEVRGLVGEILGNHRNTGDFAKQSGDRE